MTDDVVDEVVVGDAAAVEDFEELAVAEADDELLPTRMACSVPYVNVPATAVVAIRS